MERTTEASLKNLFRERFHGLNEQLVELVNGNLSNILSPLPQFEGGIWNDSFHIDKDNTIDDTISVGRGV